jgi:uncharacterized protein DUF1905
VSLPGATQTIRFDATLSTIDNTTILRLPEKASRKLPSRGQVAVQGTINGHGFQTVLEPDGYFGHWMRIDRKLQQAAALSARDTATLEMETLKDWPEPNVPQDLETALAAAPEKMQDLWKAIYTDGALGMGSLGQCNPKPCYAQTTRRGEYLENEEREATAVLFQPCRMHRPEPVQEQQAH